MIFEKKCFYPFLRIGEELTEGGDCGKIPYGLFRFAERRSNVILRIFWVISLATTIVLSVVFPGLLLWSPLLVLGSWLLLILGGIFFLFLVSLFCIKKPLASMESAFLRFLAYHTMDCILSLFRFRIRGEGMDKIPEEACVIVCNHLSRFDPMVKFVLMKGRKLSFVSKIENLRIPIAGPIIHQIGFVPLDRENALRSLRSIHSAAKLISEKQYTVGIYPEGTRSRSGELLPFKEGAFVLAKRAGCPIVISTISGTDRGEKRRFFKKHEAVFRVLDVIPSRQVKSKKTQELSENCRECIERNL